MANPRENTKAILGIGSGNSWGNLKANPLLLYPWFGFPTRAWTRPHETLQKLSKGVPQELPQTPPRSLHDSCHGSPGHMLKNAPTAPGHRSGLRFPEHSARLAKAIVGEGLQGLAKPPPRILQCFPEDPQPAYQGSALYSQDLSMDSREISRGNLECTPGIPQRFSKEFPAKARGIPGDSLTNPRGNPDPFRRRPPRIGQASPKNFAVIPRGTSTNLPSVGVVFPRSLHEFRGNPQGDARVLPKDFPVVFQ